MVVKLNKKWITLWCEESSSEFFLCQINKFINSHFPASIELIKIKYFEHIIGKYRDSKSHLLLWFWYGFFSLLKKINISWSRPLFFQDLKSHFFNSFHIKLFFHLYSIFNNILNFRLDKANINCLRFGNDHVWYFTFIKGCFLN